MLKIIKIESLLFLRERGMVAFAVLLPSLLLLVLGMIPALRTPDPVFGGGRFIDSYMSSLVVITLALLGLNKLPTTMATYREKGVLRRLSTTPMNPAKLLAAQLVISLAAAVLSILLLVVVGNLVFGIDLPHNPGALIVTVLLGASSLFALGLVAAALAPTARAASGWATVLFIVVMFFGGVYLPKNLLPGFLNRIGEYLPPGAQALQDAWLGTAPQLSHLAIMALIALLAGTVAAKSFRWE
ncbi:MAG: ABC transporter permease [Kibdelosporangium sp.]